MKQYTYTGTWRPKFTGQTCTILTEGPQMALVQFEGYLPVIVPKRDLEPVKEAKT